MATTNIKPAQYCVGVFGPLTDIYELTSALEYADIGHIIFNCSTVLINVSIGYIIVHFDMNGVYMSHRYIIDKGPRNIIGPNAKYNGISLKVGKYYSCFPYNNILENIHDQIRFYKK